jgi:hypothetical protein
LNWSSRLSPDSAQTCNASTRDLAQWSWALGDAHNGGGLSGQPPGTEETMMNRHTAKKVLGTLVAAVTLTMVTSVAPASAADTGRTGGMQSQRMDTGWDIP